MEYSLNKCAQKRFFSIYKEVLANEMEVLNVRGLNVELMDRLDDENPDMAMLSRLIQVDGEIYELEAPSFQLRYR